MLHPDIERILVTEEELRHTVTRLGRQISADYQGQSLTVICIMKGSLVFTADLIRAINFPIELDFMQASSYGSSCVSCGCIDIKRDLEEDVSGKHLLIVEDIIDSGNTLSRLKTLLEKRGAASVKICTMLNKPDRRTADVYIDYEGIRIPDEFVVGYGLDYAQKYRNLPYVGVLKRAIYE